MTDNFQPDENRPDNIPHGALEPLSVEQFRELTGNDSAVILDTRAATVFTNGFVPGSISIGVEGRFAEWARIVLPLDKTIFIIADPGAEKDLITRLVKVGFTNFGGYLNGGFNAWQQAGEPIDLVIDIEADELAMDIPHDPNLVVVDVRRETEFGDGHVTGAENIPLDELSDPLHIANFEENQNIYIHCGSGYRSVIAASLFKKQGLHNIRNVLGGFDKIKEQKGISISKENSVLN